MFPIEHNGKEKGNDVAQGEDNLQGSPRAEGLRDEEGFDASAVRDPMGGEEGIMMATKTVERIEPDPIMVRYIDGLLKDRDRLTFLLRGVVIHTEHFYISVDYGREWAESVDVQEELRKAIDRKMEEVK